MHRIQKGSMIIGVFLRILQLTSNLNWFFVKIE